MCVQRIPGPFVLKLHRLSRQSLGKAVVGSGPKFVELVHDGTYTSPTPKVSVVILLVVKNSRTATNTQGNSHLYGLRDLVASCDKTFSKRSYPKLSLETSEAKELMASMIDDFIEALVQII